MPKVIDRPTTDTRAPTIPEIEFPPPEPRGTRAPQIFRWLGWLLLVGAIAAVTFFVVDANTDDGVDTPTALVNADPGAITSDPTAPGAITADPKPRTPVGVPGAVVEVTEEATVSPWIYTRSRHVGEVDTAFPEESTVSPWIYGP